MTTTIMSSLQCVEISAPFDSPRVGASDDERAINVFLGQSPHPDSIDRRRTRQFGGKHDAAPGPDELRDYAEILSRIPATADLVILSEHSAASRHVETLRNLATANRQVIVSALGFSRVGEAAHNLVVVALPDTEPVFLRKISFSVEDQRQANDGALLRGNQLLIFDSTIGRFCVLNCHEYTHAEILSELGTKNLDFIIVTSFNPAWQLYGEYALADIHRLFCFVLLCNVGNYGGSGIYAPFSKLGDPKAAVSAGGVLFSTRGPSRSSTSLELPIGELKKMRTYRDLARFKKAAEYYQPIVPPEHVFLEDPPYRKALQNIKPVALSELGYKRRAAADSPIRIAVAQLRSPPLEAYVKNSYHVSDWEGASSFLEQIRSALERQSECDFLLMPEVFCPVGLEDDLRKFSLRTGAIVITGVEYDRQPEGVAIGSGAAKGANRCFIYVPGQEDVRRLDYMKLTRSRYDALYRDDDSELKQFPMDLGNQLLRFTHPELGSFGVLICYDYSHSEIVHALNMNGRGEPLELMFVVCHNPYEELYRACCLADCHRYYQYVVMSNVAQYGGSGVFGPVRTKGQARTLLYAGKGAEGIFSVDVDLQGLRKTRKALDYLPSAQQHRDESFQRLPGVFNVRWEAITLTRQ